MTSLDQAAGVNDEPLTERLIDQLVAKYPLDWPLQRSYPSASQFHQNIQWSDYICSQADQNDRDKPLSVYIQIPFCNDACHFCACDRIITRERGVIRRYLDALAIEVELKANLIGESRSVVSLHIGGGTPAYLDRAEITELMHSVSRYFRLRSPQLQQHSIELDPRALSNATLALLRGVGFNQIRLGVQDFDPRVQEAINRKQSFTTIAQVVENIRDQGFERLTIDMMYGLPRQDADSVAATLEKVISLRPDQVAYHPYHHLPSRFTNQHNIRRDHLPTAAATLQLQLLIAQALQASDYRLIGIDLYALPALECAVAQPEHAVAHRPQHYLGPMAQDELGFGLAALTRLGDYQFQNPVELKDYYGQLEARQIPSFRGHRATEEDKWRGHIITQLLSNMSLDLDDYDQLFGIDFPNTFKKEMQQLIDFESDGLVIIEDNRVAVTERGQPFLANISKTFDAYHTPPNFA